MEIANVLSKNTFELLKSFKIITLKNIKKH